MSGPASDWAALTSDAFFEVAACLDFREKLGIQSVCKAWRSSICCLTVWGNKLTFYNMYHGAGERVYAYLSGDCLMVKVNWASCQSAVVKWILHRARGWRQISFYGAINQDVFTLDSFLYHLLAGLQQISTPDLHVIAKGKNCFFQSKSCCVLLFQLTRLMHAEWRRCVVFPLSEPQLLLLVGTPLCLVLW